jgi:hypothetical protein
MTCGTSFAIDVVVLLKKLIVVSNSFSNSLLFCSCSKTLVSSVVSAREANGYT